MKSYKETLDYLYTQLPMFQRQGKAAFKKDLTNIFKLCNQLDNPQENFKCIHIAGTNGKGTVSHILASIFTHHGYKTGLYTSPHYKDFRERIKVDGSYIPKQEVRQFVDSILPALEEIKASFFEITVAMAFWYFDKMKCEVAIIETGLGGRLDSTNIIKPIFSIITNIGYDHQNMLGHTLEEIAGEKAGIIKRNIPVLIGERQDEIAHIFKKKAKKEDSEIFYSSDYLDLEQKGSKGHLSQFKDKLSGSEIEIEMKGPFVARNLQTSMAAIKILSAKSNDLNLTSDRTLQALRNIHALSNYIGRWQYLNQEGEKPIIIADSAHNKEGLGISLDAIGRIGFGKLHIVLGFVMEKNLDEIVGLFPTEARYYFAKADIPRGMEADFLSDSFCGMGRNGRAYSSVKNAFRAAKRAASDEDLIFIVGSIFVVGEAM